MADIVLAEHRGQAWLVCGERYIDDLLANTVSAEISIEFIRCESHADVTALWSRNGGGEMGPWAIHPGILQRFRRAAEGYSVSFGPWSALLDDAALDVVRTAAVEAVDRDEATVAVVCYGSEAPMVRTLGDVRKGLIAAALAEHGVAASRVVQRWREDGEDEGRVDIVIQVD